MAPSEWRPTPAAGKGYAEPSLILSDINRLMSDPEVLDRMNVFDYEPAPATPEQIAELIRGDTRKNAETVRRSGATAD